VTTAAAEGCPGDQSGLVSGRRAVLLAQGAGDRDHSALATLYEQLSGVPALSREGDRR
jgi:hypothetical protein